MINLDDNNQPVSPEIGKIRIKDFSDMSYTADDDKDFHIRTVRDETLIDSAGELDDSHEFALNMFDRGNASDLPARTVEPMALTGKPVLTETVKKHSQRSFMAKRRRALLPRS